MYLPYMTQDPVVSVKADLTHPVGTTQSAHPLICMVTYYPTTSILPPMHNGALSLAREGYLVEAICYAEEDHYKKIEITAPGFTTKRFRVRVRRFFHRMFGLSPGNILVAAAQYALSYSEFTIKALVSALRSKGDLYEAHDLPALLPTMIAAKIRRKPLVYHAHELYPEMQERVRFRGVWTFLDRVLVPHCTDVVTPEENRSNIYHSEFHAKRPPLTVRNCPPFAEPIKSTRLRDELTGRGLRFSKIVLYQGLLDSSRCIEELAEATVQLQDGIVLVILGLGFGKWQNPAEAVRRYPRIVALPHVPYDQLKQFTASADIGVLLYRNNCRNNFYCAPNKLHEYNMMGLPVITCHYPGLKSIVDKHDLGLCVDPEKPQEIAAAINTLATDRELYQRMSQSCLRASRETFNWENEFQKIRSRYKEILRPYRNSGV